MAKDYDDEFERPRSASGGEMGPLDGFFLNTNKALLILLAVCCGLVALILSIIELATGKNPTAKANAKLVLIIVIVLTAVSFVLNVALGVGGAMMGGAGAPR